MNMMGGGEDEHLRKKHKEEEAMLKSEIMNHH